VPTTAFGWPVVPEGLTELLVGLGERYGAALPPITVTENGCSTADEPDAAGAVHDQARIDYLDGHIRALHAALSAGVDVRGYLTWSLLDNFEWAEGYEQRFGLVRTDYATLRRTPKDSYDWFRAQLGAQRDAALDTQPNAARDTQPDAALDTQPDAARRRQGRG
jgi:beta-glucosidase